MKVRVDRVNPTGRCSTGTYWVVVSELVGFELYLGG